MGPINVPESQNLEKGSSNISTQASPPHASFIYIGAFIGIVFLILIFTLNYFNILSISTLLPNQFGWLPHKEKVAINSKKPNEKFSQNQSAPTPTGYIKFPYDTTRAARILKDYITNNIKETHIPPKIDVQQHLLSTGELKGTDYQFGANWTSDDAIFNAVLHYIKHTNDLRDTEFFIIPQNTKDILVDPTNSARLVKNYLKNIPQTVNFDCGVFEKTTRFCEHFTINDAGKSGFGIVRGKDNDDSDILFIFSCFFPKNDSYYNRRTSCLLFREKDPTGL